MVERVTTLLGSIPSLSLVVCSTIPYYSLSTYLVIMIIPQLNSDTTITEFNGFTVVDTGENYRVYNYLHDNRFYIYCGHKCDENLKSVEEVKRLSAELKAVNPVYLICGGYEGYLIADNFKAFPDDLFKMLEREHFSHSDNKGEKVHILEINLPSLYQGKIGYTEKLT